MNMSYCRFRNTLEALEECQDHMVDKLSPEEDLARKKLIALCKSTADDLADEEED